MVPKFYGAASFGEERHLVLALQDVVQLGFKPVNNRELHSQERVSNKG